jgi:hypothetical protein
MRESTRVTLAGGLYAGLLGYAVVVVFVGAVNFAGGRSPFYTAALFGAALFHGLEDPASLQVAAGPVLAYNMVHLLAFLGLGFLASWLVSLAERYPVARYVTLFTLVFVAAHVYAALLLFAQPLLAAAAWWQIGSAGLLAAAAMGWYLLQVHAGLRRSLTENPMGAEEE